MANRGGDNLFALVELAKWCEHHKRDFERALDWVERAAACMPDLAPDECSALAHRRERLLRKLDGRKTSP
jgi:hypothetical protein